MGKKLKVGVNLSFVHFSSCRLSKSMLDFKIYFNHIYIGHHLLQQDWKYKYDIKYQ
jgi:hypothetical protein